MIVPLADTARALASTAAADRAVGLLERLHRGDGRTFAVLTYHRVDEVTAQPELHPGLLSATPGTFRAEMAAIADRWTPISLADVLAARRGAPLPRRSVLVTIDDAYEDTARHAWPVLHELGVPGVLFVPTGFPDEDDRSFWWDDLHRALRSAGAGRVRTPVGSVELTDEASRGAAFRSLRSWYKATRHEEATARFAELLLELGAAPRRPPVLGWDELRRLHGEGLTLAPHSVSHAMLDRVDADRVVEEVTASRRRLHEEVGVDVPAFAYPSGQHDDAVVRAVAGTGIEVAFTTRRGVNRTRDADWLRLRRINVSQRMPPAAVRAQLLPAVSSLAARIA